MKISRTITVPSAVHVAFTTLLLFMNTAAHAAPYDGVTGNSMACAMVGGTGTKCGEEWNVSPGAGVGSKSFTSNATIGGDYHTPDGSLTHVSSTANTSFSATASTGRLSASASATATYSNPDNVSLGYHAWTYSGVSVGWSDMLTVVGGIYGAPVTVNMTVKLSDTISSGSSDSDSRSWLRSALAGASLEAASGIDSESGGPLFVGTGLSDAYGDPKNALQTAQFSFKEFFGVPFEVRGLLGVGASAEISELTGATNQWAIVDASHTMLGFFDIMDAQFGQRITSESGWDYSLTAGNPPPGGSVPEPGTLALVLCGVLLLSPRARRWTQLHQ